MNQMYYVYNIYFNTLSSFQHHLLEVTGVSEN